MLMRMPRPGDVVVIGRAANYQYEGRRSIRLKITGIEEEPIAPGLAWLRGYQLGPTGAAIAKRTVLVRLGGLVYVWTPHPLPVVRQKRPGPKKRGAALCPKCWRWRARVYSASR
ncbi:hypothetical protein [Rhizomonospora bruguierae]|uniref:hypothetical protein n=1 Tax=Rhizomonospora bruguierae TaxID=1581705 RepID=UPI001BD009B9|nr:hypothetical protein [Micromonospora sp. NBRC 107566]